MYTWTSKKLLFVFLGLFKLVLSFNIDVKYPVIKEGKPGTYFGFAVAQHKVTAGTKVEDWQVSDVYFIWYTLLARPMF